MFNMIKPLKKQIPQKKKCLINTIGLNIIFVHVSSSNVIINITTIDGDTKIWFSMGRLGLQGREKNTPVAFQKLATAVAEKTVELNLKDLILRVYGTGDIKINCLKALVETDIDFCKIEDVTTFPFNGCRPKKARRI